MAPSVLVTGGAGFIGSHLVDALLAIGMNVTVLDNFSSGRRENLSGHEHNSHLTVVDANVEDAAEVDRIVAKQDVVYHLAAAVGVRHIVDDPIGATFTNVHGTENVLAAAHRHGARVVLASSSEIYGISNELPFREDGPRTLGPTWVHRWSYATSKAIDEHLAFAYADRGLAVSVVRYFNAYGPRIREHGYGSVIARFARQALFGESITVHGDGRQTRSFTYVADTVRGTVLAGQQTSALGMAVNIGSSEEITILELAHRVRDLLGSKSRVVMTPYHVEFPGGFADTRRRVPDTERARALLGFTTAVSLERGLELTLSWCRDNFGRAVRSS
jgi:UDP-glucose 4-epimerase